MSATATGASPASRVPATTRINFAAADAGTSSAGPPQLHSPSPSYSNSNNNNNSAVPATQTSTAAPSAETSVSRQKQGAARGSFDNPRRPPPREERPINDYFRRKLEIDADAHRAEKDVLRARLHKFFEHYSPHLYHEVDNLVSRFWQPERQVELFDKLHKKYGPDPAPPKEGMDTVSRLKRFFLKYDPDLVEDDKIKLIMDSYGGYDAVMWRALTAKYGPELSLEESTGKAGMFQVPMDLLSRLQRFFKKHDMPKLAKSQELAEQHKDKEADLRSMLKIVYGAELEVDPEAEAHEALAAKERARMAEMSDEAKQEETKRWLVVFLEQHNPKRLNEVDSLLAHFKGRSESLRETVVSLFGTGAIDFNTPRLRLIRMYQRYNPNKIEEVDYLLERFQNRYEELFTMLRDKYGPEPVYEPNEEMRQFQIRQENALPNAMSDRTRKRLQLFFLTWDPRLASSVEHVMTLFRGKEEEMWKSLTDKYGPEPPFRDVEEEERLKKEADEAGERARKAAAAAAESAKPQKLTSRERVEVMWARYAPEKLEDPGALDHILNKYAGKEQDLIDMLKRKYGPEPKPPTRGEYAAARGHRIDENGQSVQKEVDPKFRNAIMRIYINHMPTKVNDVNAICERYVGREDELIEILKARFGEEVQSPNAPPPSSGPERFASMPIRERVARIYFVYAPAKLALLDEALEKYAGREEKLIEMLQAKYSFTVDPSDDQVETAKAQLEAAKRREKKAGGGVSFSPQDPSRD